MDHIDWLLHQEHTFHIWPRRRRAGRGDRHGSSPYFILFEETRDHDDDGRMLLPDHSIEVHDRVGQWTLRGDEGMIVARPTVDIVCIDVER